MSGPYFSEAANTIKAGRLELLLARIFGRKYIGRDGLFEVEIKVWRGKAYLMRSRRLHGEGE